MQLSSVPSLLETSGGSLVPPLSLSTAFNLPAPSGVPLTPRGNNSNSGGGGSTTTYYLPAGSNGGGGGGFEGVPVFRAVIETGEDEFVRGTRGLPEVPLEDRPDIKDAFRLLKELHHIPGGRPCDEPTELAVVPRTDSDGSRIDYYEIYAYGYADEITLDNLLRIKQSNSRIVRVAVQVHAIGENAHHSRGAVVLRVQSRSDERVRKRRVQETALLHAGLVAEVPEAEAEDADAKPRQPPTKKKRGILDILLLRPGTAAAGWE
jgi:hypothetical protein